MNFFNLICFTDDMDNTKFCLFKKTNCLGPSFLTHNTNTCTMEPQLFLKSQAVSPNQGLSELLIMSNSAELTYLQIHAFDVVFYAIPVNLLLKCIKL